MQAKRYFFCGVGGSGMMPLALILKSLGHDVSGSDRSYDQAKDAPHAKFTILQDKGIQLVPQNGTGVAGHDILVVSGAIEDSVPDVKAAKDHGIVIQTRAEILSALFNASPCGISVAGTSGKSTVTGMIATILSELGADPTVMNGGLINNFKGAPQSPAPNMRIGAGDYFVTETDESDGSIALYNPAIAVVNNIALDHMPLEDLQEIFAEFIGRSTKACILNADNPYIQDLRRAEKTPPHAVFYSVSGQGDFNAQDIQIEASSASFTVKGVPVRLQVSGLYNVQNALAALAVAVACGFDLAEAAQALGRFTGIHRRMEKVAERDQIIVFDDFAHNPDKIEASLRYLKSFDGRLIIMFQPHGFAPLRLMGDEIIDAFTQHLGSDDILCMPEVYYAGGTVDRSVTAKDIIQKACKSGVNAHHFNTREDAKTYIRVEIRTGDRIIVMGARDDTLPAFARSILD